MHIIMGMDMLLRLMLVALANRINNLSIISKILSVSDTSSPWEH